MRAVLKYKAFGYREIEEYNPLEERCTFDIKGVFIKERKIAIVFEYNNKAYKTEIKLFGALNKDWQYFIYREDDGVGKVLLGLDKRYFYIANLDMKHKLCIVGDEYKVTEKSVFVNIGRRADVSACSLMQSGSGTYYCDDKVDMETIDDENCNGIQFVYYENIQTAYKIVGDLA